MLETNDWRGMGKPLIPNQKRVNEAIVWHVKVFRKYGGAKKICTLCGRSNATDAAHVIGRAKLGPLRYIDERLGRPLHRHCHEDVDNHRTAWPLEIRQDATRVFNEYAKVKMVVPEE